MHSNISECDTELEIPTKKIKLSSAQEACKTKERILSKVLQKEIQQEINLRKEDLELIEGNIFLVRQKLTQLKQVLAAEYYHQKSVKGCLQFPPHPAVKDTFIGKCPAGFGNQSSVDAVPNEVENLESEVVIKSEFDPSQEVTKQDSVEASSAEIKKLLESDKLPCYIPPKNTDDNVVKPTEPRGIDSKKEIRIIVGNVSKWLAPSESSDATHKWTVYAKLAQSDLDIALFVKKVVFFLHKSYRPNDVIEIKYPPFKLTRRGWGEFPLKAQFHFKSLDNPPIDVMHHLKLDHIHTGFETFGSETSLTVWVHHPSENGILNEAKKPMEGIIIKTEDSKNTTGMIDNQTLNGSKTYQQNIFENSETISDVSRNANTYSVENDLNTGGFNFETENPYDTESINKLLEEIKNEDLQSLTSLLTSLEGKVQTDQNPIKENEWNQTVLNPVKNNIIECKPEIEEKFSSTQSFQESQSVLNEVLEEKTKIQENVSEINFNEFESEGLFVDECAVVGEEIVIDCDDCELDDCNDVKENEKTSFHECLDTKDSHQTSENNTSSSLHNSLESISIISSKVSNINLTNMNDNTSNTEMSLNSIVQQLGIDVDAAKSISSHSMSTDKHEEIKEIEVSSVLQDQKLNKIIPKNSAEIINGLALNNCKKVQKNTEKKSMIITLQKENGQIILRKEAKVQKFKESSPKKGIIVIDKKPIICNNKSLLNSNPIPVKQNRIIVDVKKQLSVKFLPNQSSNLTKNVPSASKQQMTLHGTLQKKSHPGTSILKKVKNLNKEELYEGMSERDLAQQCPIQNTEIAVNWLMKKFPLVDTRASKAGFHMRYPYCAKDRDTFLNWPLAKQRAAEWMRAKAIGRILNKFPDLQKWTNLEILDWARVRCYTPIKNNPDYDGPTVEPSLNFVYRPRIEGIVELLKQDKILAEKEIVNVADDSPAKDELSGSDIAEPAGTSRAISNENSTQVPLDQELEGFTSFVNRCMMNIVGEKPSPEELLPDVQYPAVERVFISVFSSIAEELIRRSYNASWIRHCDNPPPEISIADVKAAILSRKEFDFLLPLRDNKGKEQPSVISYFRK